MAEELKGADKISERDKHRWELDPASSEDYPDRDSYHEHSEPGATRPARSRAVYAVTWPLA